MIKQFIVLTIVLELNEVSKMTMNSMNHLEAAHGLFQVPLTNKMAKI